MRLFLSLILRNGQRRLHLFINTNSLKSLTRSFCSFFIKNAPRFARRSTEYGYDKLNRTNLEDLLARFKAEHVDPTVGDIYARHLRHLQSDTNTEYQPTCNYWCQAQDLCDKEFGAHSSTLGDVTNCLVDAGYDFKAETTTPN